MGNSVAGRLLAACLLLLCSAPVSGVWARAVTVLHSIVLAEGGWPGTLVQDDLGNFFGMTSINGGTIFKLAPDGTYTVLYRLALPNGEFPGLGLTLDKAGNLYGTTHCNAYCGTIFMLAPDGTYTVLHHFTGADGWNPLGGLVLDDAGNLYGTTFAGGSGCSCGTIFSLAPDGTYTVLHNFSDADGGATPVGGLLRDKAGNFFGVAASGGSHSHGVVFKLAPDGTYTLLHSFTGADGDFPAATLVQDKAGNLYGTTQSGGPADAGAVFKLAPDGTYTLLHLFAGGIADGMNPTEGSLALDEHGIVYGMTSQGGVKDYGLVFKIKPGDTLKIMHKFMNRTDGFSPRGGLIWNRMKKGRLTGSAIGGPSVGGVIFEIPR